MKNIKYKNNIRIKIIKKYHKNKKNIAKNKRII